MGPVCKITGNAEACAICAGMVQAIVNNDPAAAQVRNSIGSRLQLGLANRDSFCRLGALGTRRSLALR